MRGGLVWCFYCGTTDLVALLLYVPLRACLAAYHNPSGSTRLFTNREWRYLPFFRAHGSRFSSPGRVALTVGIPLSFMGDCGMDCVGCR